jgi:hypothetical protein
LPGFWPFHQLRQLSDIRRDPPCLVACEQLGCGPSSGLGFEIHISQCHPVIVADDEAAAIVLFDVPGRRESASRHRRDFRRG